MRKSLKWAALAGTMIVGLGGVAATPAAAQATRTWVSGVGDDVNPCSRTAPCKTFAGAISKTAAGGEINCLDPGGFGAVSIIKSMTISCPYTEGGALAGGNGVTVNLPASTDVVFLRGLDIFGVNPPSNGVRFIAQGTLHIEDSVIRRFNAANSQGVSFQPSGAAELYISNTTIAENGTAGSGGGILIQPTGAAGSAKVHMSNVRVHNNSFNGIRIDTTGNTAPAGVFVTMDEFSVVGNAGNGINLNAPAGTTIVRMNMVDGVVSHNTGTGITASGTGAIATVARTTILGNNTGLATASGGQLLSYGDNLLGINIISDGAFSGPATES